MRQAATIAAFTVGFAMIGLSITAIVKKSWRSKIASSVVNTMKTARSYGHRLVNTQEHKDPQSLNDAA